MAKRTPGVCAQCGGPTSEVKARRCIVCAKGHPDRTVRFWSRVRKGDGCWEWTGCMWSYGYGMFTFQSVSKMAHRVGYELSVGPIPDGLVLDHLCRNRRCVRPDHLEPVTLAENTLRGESLPALYRLRTHCRNGHPFTSDNLYRDPKYPNARLCRTCRTAYAAAYRQRRRAAA